MGTLLAIVTNYGKGTLFDLIHANEVVKGYAKTGKTGFGGEISSRLDKNQDGDYTSSQMK